MLYFLILIEFVIKKLSTHMLPSVKNFEKEISKLGINKKDIIIIYCKEGILSSPESLVVFLPLWA